MRTWGWELIGSLDPPDMLRGGECEWGRSGGGGNFQPSTTIGLYTSQKGTQDRRTKRDQNLPPSQQFVGLAVVTRSIGVQYRTSKMPRIFKCGSKRGVPVTAFTHRYHINSRIQQKDVSALPELVSEPRSARPGRKRFCYRTRQ